MGKWIKKRGERSPDAGCRLDPLVTKNKSLFSGVGEGSLVKSTNLHTHTHTQITRQIFKPCISQTLPALACTDNCEHVQKVHVRTLSVYHWGC